MALVRRRTRLQLTIQPHQTSNNLLGTFRRVIHMVLVSAIPLRWFPEWFYDCPLSAWHTAILYITKSFSPASCYPQPSELPIFFKSRKPPAAFLTRRNLLSESFSQPALLFLLWDFSFGTWITYFVIYLHDGK